MSRFSFKFAPTNFIIAVVAIALTLLLLDTFLLLSGIPLDQRTPFVIAARQANLPFDTRTPMQVADELSQSGIEAYPYMAPNWFTYNDSYDSHIGPLYVLGGIANVATVVCNESGHHMIYESDRYGFHNENEVWDQSSVEIVALGDSFTQGWCVQPEETYINRIRSKYPSTLNLGASGNGPLSAFATFQEYAVARKPQHVLWFYFEGNDISDFKRELQNTILVKYLSGTYSQDLSVRQFEIDEQRKTLLEELTMPKLRQLTGLLQLHNVRSLVTMVHQRFSNAQNSGTYAKTGVSSADNKETPDCDINSITKSDVFSMIQTRLLTTPETPKIDLSVESRIEYMALLIAKLQTQVNAWGGKLTVVYLPDYGRVMADGRLDEFAYYRPCVLSAFEHAAVDVLDLSPLFVEHPEPLSLFPFGLFAHYSADGNELIANKVLEYLNQ